MSRLIISLTALVLISSWCLGQGRSGSFSLSKGDLIEDIIFEYYDVLGFNGSVLVASEGQVIYENTFGLANFDTSEPLDGALPFYIASVSKQFTAAAILRLQEEGKLSVNDPVRKFFPMMPSYYEKVTLHHLLTHTSGIPDYLNDFGEIDPGFDNMDVYKLLINQKRLDFAPGSRYKYSNSGYVLLAMVVQIASGKRIENYFEDEIFGPINMNDSFIFSEATRNRQRVLGYDNRNKPDDYNLLTVGDGGFYTTANDLYKWTTALNSEKFINAQSLEMLYQPVILSGGSERRYGYGWEIGSNIEGKLVYHTGELRGFRTYLEYQLANGNAIIILSNNSFSGVAELRNTLVKVLDGRLESVPELKD